MVRHRMGADTLNEHDDFVTWTERQADAPREAGRHGANLPLDWNRLAEEIEDLGTEVRHKVQSLAFQIQVHLLKIACSPATDEHPHWMGEIDQVRQQLDRQLRDNDVLRQHFDELSAAETAGAVTAVERTFRTFGETSALPQLSAWKLRGMRASEVLGDGFPEPGSLMFRPESE